MNLRKLSCTAFGIGLALNGLLMLFAPLEWFERVPTVTGAGPFNPHFVRDVGCAYLAAGLGFAWLARDARARPAAAAGALFLVLHALTHVAEYLEGRAWFPDVLFDLVLVFFPAGLAIVLSRPPRGPAA
jgi:hypothetical protein